MKNYERPIVMINEDLAEGVYAASGDGCWTFTYTLTPNNDVFSEGTGCEIQVDGFHNNPQQHRAYFVLNIVLNQQIIEVASFSGATSCVASGNTLIVGWDITTNNPTEKKGFAVRVAVEDGTTLDVLRDQCSYTCPN